MSDRRATLRDTRVVASALPTAPALLGRYQVVETLGRGAMGVVYKGYDPLIARSVALKTIRKDLLDQDHLGESIERFRNEAMASGRLNHPGIIAIHEYGEHENTAFIVMEYAPGDSLAGYISRRTSIRLDEIGGIMAQILDALGYAHDNGIIHRDVKPGNVIVGPTGRIKVTDFGIARINSSTLTQTGMIMGTPSYMAPEQYVGLAIDQRADVFSAGVLLYELLTGIKPFAGATHTVAYKICHEPHRPPSQVNAGLPGSLDAVLSRALAKKPEARFSSAREFAAALSSVIQHHEMHSQEPTVIRTGAATAQPSGKTGEPSSLDLTGWQPGALSAIEEALAPYVGPLARTLIKRHAARSFSLAEFQETLSRAIDDPVDRAGFLEISKPVFDLLGQRAVAAASPMGTTVAGEAVTAVTEAQRIQAVADLTLFLGPIAKVLVRKAAPNSPHAGALYVRLSEHLGSQTEKSQFLKMLKPS